MKKPPQSRDQSRRHLSKEDRELWETTAGTLEPLKRAKARVHPRPQTAPDERRAASAESGAPTTAAKHTAAKPATSERGLLVGPSSASPPPLNLFDRKAARRLRGGRVEIEARVDLHGLRQSEAHTALHRFLLSCHARGLRWVLVITGKGAPRRRGEEEEYGTASEERGVLKRSVPVWLAEPELRAIVVSFTAAAIQHGGEGALYVQLRNPERTKRRT